MLRYDFAANGLIGLQTGAAYSQKGASESEDGSEIAIEASCSLTGTDGSVSVDVDCDSDGLEEFGFETECTAFSLLFGGGLEVAAGPGALTFDGRYDLGLTNINASEGTDQLEAKNRNIQISAGYQVRLR